MAELAETRRRRSAAWPQWVWRGVSVFYAYGAMVHVANLAGWSPMLESVDVPTHWVVADVVYLILDVAVVVGVWMRRWWGTVAFLVATTSQIVIYTFFASAFAIEPEHYAAIRRPVVFHIAALSLYGGSVWLARRPVSAVAE